MKKQQKLYKAVKVGKRGHKTIRYRDTSGRFVKTQTALDYFQSIETAKRERLKAAAEKAKKAFFEQPDPDELRMIQTKKGIRFIDERGRFVNKVFWPEEYRPMPSTEITYWEGASYLKDTPEKFVKFIIRDQTGKIIESHTVYKNEAIREMQEFIRLRNSESKDGHYYIIKIYHDLKNEKTVTFDIHDYGIDLFNEIYGNIFK